jgi:LysM repeat protein
MTPRPVPHTPAVRAASHQLRAALLALLGLLVLAVGAIPAMAASATVARGETLSHVAARHGVSVASLAAANGIRNPNLVVAGTVLRVPAGGSAAGAGSGTGGSYRVRAGDTLSGIAARAGVSQSALMSANGIRNANLVVAGTVLRLPGGSSVASTPSGGGGASWGGSATVRAGDTLSAIAARHGVSASSIAAANGLRDPNSIRAGQRLRVPGSGGGAGGGTGHATVGNGEWYPRSAVPALIASAAARHGVDPALARAVAWQESGWNNTLTSHARAIGIMQVLPETAAWVGPSLVGRTLNPYSARDNVEAGVAYLGWLLRQTGSTRQAVMGYYQGLRSLRTRGPYDDSLVYARAVLAHYGRV